MNITKRQVTLFLAGMVLVVMVVALVWRVVGSRPVSKVDAAAPDSPSALLSASQQAFTCQVSPVVAVTHEKDGQFPFQPDLSCLTAAEIGSFIVIGKEAASAGRPRDAETAFLMACQLAEKFKGTGSVESADAKYQLGWHYATLAQNNPAGPVAHAGSELLDRAQHLHADSLDVYRSTLGEAHEKFRFAAEGVASVKQTLAQTMPSSVSVFSASGNANTAKEPVNAAMAGHSAAPPAPGSTPPNAELAKAAPRLRPTSIHTARIRPSFDCRLARSIPEKMICSDEELAQLDRELGRVYKLARNATTDRVAFRRDQNQEWLRRESSCRDRDCLLRWFSERREQLMSNIEDREPLSETASR